MTVSALTIRIRWARWVIIYARGAVVATRLAVLARLPVTSARVDALAAHLTRVMVDNVRVDKKLTPVR